MKIKVSSIPPRGFTFQEELDPQNLNDRLNEAQGNDITVNIAPVVNATISKTMYGADLTGSIAASVIQPCGRCGEEFPHETTAEIKYTLRPQKVGEELEDDIGISYYNDDHFDSTDVCQESLIMSLSPFWKPGLDDNEFCKQCGKNCAQAGEQGEVEKPKQILGDLLKKAGVN